MTESSPHLTYQIDLETLQDEVLNRLDELNLRIEAALAELLKGTLNAAPRTDG